MVSMQVQKKSAKLKLSFNVLLLDFLPSKERHHFLVGWEHHLLRINLNVYLIKLQDGLTILYKFHFEIASTEILYQQTYQLKKTIMKSSTQTAMWIIPRQQLELAQDNLIKMKPFFAQLNHHSGPNHRTKMVAFIRDLRTLYSGKEKTELTKFSLIPTVI